MVTHDPLVASFSERVIMLKDGQVFTEIFLESSAPVGSSAKIILGYVINARAADVLCRCPPDELYNATIVMVTHDPLAASFSERVIMLKDGQVFTEIYSVESSSI
jgi:ABC-type lipoprotein export system ATPase subunit